MNNMHPLQYFFSKISTTPEVLFVPLLAFMAPITGILVTVVLVILLDTATGIWKSRKNKVPITSRRFSALLSKILLYELTVLVTYFVDHYVAGELIFFSDIPNVITKVVSLVIICIEAKSINENFEAVRGIGLFQAFKNLVSRTDEIKKDIKDLTK